MALPEQSFLNAAPDLSGGANGSQAHAKPKSAIIAAAAVAAVVLAGGGYAAGFQVGKQQSGTAANGGAMGSQGQGGFGSRVGRGGFGDVTAVSSSSITVQNARTGTATTYAIDANTKVLNAGAAGKVSDIASGDRVVVTPSTADAKTAAEIMIGGGPGAGAPASGAAPGGSSAAGSN